LGGPGVPVGLLGGWARSSGWPLIGWARSSGWPIGWASRILGGPPKSIGWASRILGGQPSIGWVTPLPPATYEEQIR
jgi:hypothetical protein